MRTSNRSSVLARAIAAHYKGAGAAATLVFLIPLNCPLLSAQDQNAVSERIQKLSVAMAATQEQLEQSQRQMDEMRRELAELQRQLAQGGSTLPTPSSSE